MASSFPTSPTHLGYQLDPMASQLTKWSSPTLCPLGTLWSHSWTHCASHLTWHCPSCSHCENIFQNTLYHLQFAIYTLIWKPHCHDTVWWEKLNHIDQKTKHIYDSDLRKQRQNTFSFTHYHTANTNANLFWDKSLHVWLSTHIGSWKLPTLPDSSVLCDAPAGIL